MIDRELIQKAESGDVDAIISLGFAYYDREAGEENRGKAFELYTKALTLDPSNAKAINNLGNCYNNGVGVERNTEKAMTLYRQAAEMGYSNAQYNLADGLRKQENSECLVWYQRAFENGDIDAPYDIANLYREGEIIPKDLQKYIEYLVKADEIGNDSATLDLACAYFQGEGVEVDKEKGIELMGKAANAGNGIAASNMSLAYRKGDGVEVNIEKSIEWAKKAAELGDNDRIFQYAVAYFNGEEPVKEDKAKAVEFFILAANAGSSTAMENLGVCYNNGFGVELDKIKAIEWFEKAATEGGSKKAMDNLEDLYLEVDANTSKDKYFQLVKTVADNGYYDAMVRTHFCYRDGSGTEKDMDKAMQYLNDAVEGKYANACFLKGLYFYGGDNGVEQDKSKAVQLWEIAANKDHSRAAEYLGECYRDGDGVEVDVAKAIAWFEKAKDLGNTKACIKLGLAYDKDGFAGTDYVKAVGYYKEAYDNGSADGACCLACMYENGWGVEQNVHKAFELYKFAADNGSARGMAKTGMLLHDGDGTPKNIKQAIEYFEKAKTAGWKDADNLLAFVYKKVDSPDVDPKKAFEFNLERAEKGDVEAQYHVYEAYWNGVGVEEDHDKADIWLKKAADGGHTISQALMGFQEMLFGDASIAVQYWEKASAAGHLKATSDLAGVYLDGADGVPMNKARAIELYKKAADAGFGEAQGSLGVCYATGNGVPKNDYEAFRWFSMAAEQGEEFAQKNLAICYRNGEGTPVNKALAAQWFEKAAAQGNIQAKSCLADMYAEGEGIIANYSKAEELYKEVIANGEGNYYEDAVFSLALMYATKTNDHYRAFPLWQQLASRGNTTAKFNLGLCYQNGWGTACDDSKALYWWHQAAAEGHEGAQTNARLLEQEMQSGNNNNGGQQATQTSMTQNAGGGGCYVATAVYGSYDCPEVWTLRRYRDYTLAETWYGRAFIRLYYALSPTLVKWFGKSSWFKKMWKGKLDRMVTRLQSSGIDSTPYNDRPF